MKDDINTFLHLIKYYNKKIKPIIKESSNPYKYNSLLSDIDRYKAWSYYVDTSHRYIVIEYNWYDPDNLFPFYILKVKDLNRKIHRIYRDLREVEIMSFEKINDVLNKHFKKLRLHVNMPCSDIHKIIRTYDVGITSLWANTYIEPPRTKYSDILWTICANPIENYDIIEEEKKIYEFFKYLGIHKKN